MISGPDFLRLLLDAGFDFFTGVPCSLAKSLIATLEERGGYIPETREDAAFPAFFLQPGVTHFSLFGVDPDAQGRGIGHRLLEAVDARAAQLGATELALSMAEPDTNLLSFYLRQGFRFIEHWQWPYTNYRSAILSRGVRPVA